jgi:hypothetical protein
MSPTPMRTGSCSSGTSQAAPCSIVASVSGAPLAIRSAHGGRMIVCRNTAPRARTSASSSDTASMPGSVDAQTSNGVVQPWIVSSLAG